MNLFLLSENPKQCAQWHCDKHVVKMILEIVQMLYTSWHMNNSGVPDTAPICKSTGLRGYKKAHPNHPMTKWVRASRSNYALALAISVSLAIEFKYRYGHHHGCVEHILWLARNPPNFDAIARTELPQCMPDEYKVPGDSVQAYRKFYCGGKAHFCAWSRRDAPIWFTNNTHS